MLAHRQTLPIAVTIAVNPRIVRKGPPVIGQLYFDDHNRLIYITGNPSVRRYTWHRVMIDGTLSIALFGGEWNWGEGKRGTV